MTHVRSIKKVGVFIQAQQNVDIAKKGNDSVIWKDIQNCVSNIGDARILAQNYNKVKWDNVHESDQFSFDIILSLSAKLISQLNPGLKMTGASHVHKIKVPYNSGLDIKQFLLQLHLVDKKRISYDYILKIHSKNYRPWRRHAFESLCGSAAQVLSIMNTLNDKKRNIGVVVPQGLTIKKSTDVNQLFQPLRNYYVNKEGKKAFVPAEAFSSSNVNNMKKIYFKMFGEHLNTNENNYICNSGTMFWAKTDSFNVTKWQGLLSWFKNKWTKGYVEDGGIEHAIERLFVTIPHLQGVNIAEVIPAPKPIGIYFPQYHKIPENERIHGDGFTEWTLLKPSNITFLAKPLATESGGLGYYDLTDINIRRRQGELARLSGLHGFMYYHYWFTGESSIKYSNPVMGKIPELLLQDGEPNMPFMFSWANEPWTSTWSGRDKDGKEYIAQKYGDREEWIKHFNYLLPFFKHNLYIRVDGKPAFVIYRVGHMKNVLLEMLLLWRKMAKESGLHGLHIVFTLNNFIHKDSVLENRLPDHCDASFQFFPTLAAAFPNVSNASSTFDINTGDDKPQYWGGFVGFSNKVRRTDRKSWTKLVSPDQFKENFRYSIKTMATELPFTRNQIQNPNFFFLTAWNEWNEQAQLEPSDRYGFAYLSAIKSVLEGIPMEIIK